MLYVLNTTILTNTGLFKLSDVSLEEVKELISSNPNFVSGIGHQSTADIISSLIGASVPMNRINVYMEKGDIALCFKLDKRPEEGSILSVEQIQELGFSWKLLERLD